MLTKLCGLTNSYHNLFGSFQRWDGAKEHQYNIIHYDETKIEKNVHIDSLKEKIWDKIKPDLIICSLLGQSKLNPSMDFFKFFKERGTKISIIWPDIRL